VVQKSPEAFRTISEVADTLDLPAHVLRFWESRFSQIKPVKRGGGRRYYRPQDINLLRGIRDLLYSDGESIKGVQKILREQGVRHVVALGAEIETDTPQEAAQHAPEPPKTRSVAPSPTMQTHEPPTEPTEAQRRDTTQRDLFDDFVPAPSRPRQTSAPQQAAAEPIRQPDKLRQKREILVLLEELVALRDAMKAQD
jgi:DNA-binding transcriptional MerR regulator